MYTYYVVYLYVVDTPEIGPALPDENPGYALQPARQDCIPVDHCY